MTITSQRDSEVTGRAIDRSDRTDTAPGRWRSLLRSGARALGVLVASLAMAGAAQAATIQLTVVSKNGVGGFAFTGAGGAITGFPETITTLTIGVGVAGVSHSFTNEAAITVTQTTVPAGFVMESVSCTGQDAGPTVSLLNKTITFGAGQTGSGAIACTVTMSKIALDLSLCLDSSGSMSDAEWDIQTSGTATGLATALAAQTNSAVRLSIVQFPGPTSGGTNAQGDLVLGPTVVSSGAVLTQFTNSIASLARTTGATNTSSCMEIARSTLGCGTGVPGPGNQCPVDLVKRVIDISTDGNPTEPGNDSEAEAAAILSASRAATAGVGRLNVIGVGLDASGVANAQSWIFPAPTATFTAPDAPTNTFTRGFLEIVQSFTGYTPAIQAKINAELQFPVDLTKSFSPNTFADGGFTTLTFTMSNPANNAAQPFAFTDTLPAGLKIDTPNGLNTTGMSPNCSGGTITATQDTTSIVVSGWTIAAGTGVPTTCTFSVNVTNVTGNLNASCTGNPASFTNSATNISGVTNINDLINPSCVTVTPETDLSVTKTDGTATYTPGTTTTYTIVVSNAGPSNATGALVGDVKPAQVTSWAWACTSEAGGASGCTPAASSAANFTDTVNLPSGASITYTVSAAISAGATGDLVNTVTVTTPTGATDPTPTNNSATDTDTATPSADLTVTKTDGVTSYTPGTTTTYTIVVTNVGPSNATGALVNDTIPPQLTSWAWACTSQDGGASGCTPAASSASNFSDTVNLPAGASITYTVSAVISAGATGDLVNTVTVTTPTGVTDPTPTNNSATDTDAIGAQADLSVTKTDGVTTYTPGTTTTYTIVVTNAGPSNATGALVGDVKPAQITSWAWACTSQDGGASGCTPAASSAADFTDTVNLPSGASITYTVSAAISAGATGDLVNTVTVTTPTGVTDPTPTNNSATDTDTATPSADLTVTKTDGVTSVTAGNTTTYTIVVTNVGPSNATGALVTDNIPAELDSWAWACTSQLGGASGCTPAASSASNFSDTVNLPAGASITYTVSAVVAADATGTLVNTVTVTTPTGVTDPTPTNNSATDTDEIIPGTIVIAIGKSASTVTPASGGPLDFTITVTNNGPASGDGSVLTDPAVPGFTATGVTCSVDFGGAVCPVLDPAAMLAAIQSGPGLTLPTFPANSQLRFLMTGTFELTSGTLTNVATLTPPSGIPVEAVVATATVGGESVPVPTLGQFALIALMLLLATMGGVYVRRARRG